MEIELTDQSQSWLFLHQLRVAGVQGTGATMTTSVTAVAPDFE